MFPLCLYCACVGGIAVKGFNPSRARHFFPHSAPVLADFWAPHTTTPESIYRLNLLLDDKIIDNTASKPQTYRRQTNHGSSKDWYAFLLPLSSAVRKSRSTDRGNYEGLAYGLNKGYSGVTLRDPKARVSRRKGALSKKTAFVREIVKEVAGYIHNSNPHHPASPLLRQPPELRPPQITNQF